MDATLNKLGEHPAASERLNNSATNGANLLREEVVDG